MSIRNQVRYRTRGLTLIEVLIALVVLSTGLLALAALQAALVRNSADSKQRSQIMAFVDSVFERSLTNYDAVDEVLTVDADLLTQVRNEAGAADLSLAPAGSGSGVVEYGFCGPDREFVVARDAGGNDVWPTATCGVFTSGTASYKEVTLLMRWTDSVGAAREMEFKTAVSPIALSLGQTLTSRPINGGAGIRPIVRRSSPDGEGIIPIAMGDGRETAATNPRPELVGNQNNTLVSDTRFEIITYTPYSEDGFALAEVQKRIETAVVGCECQTGDSFGSTGFAGLQGDRAFRPTYWDGSRYVVPEASTEPILGSPRNVTQSALCDTCCRDHHDPAGTSGAKFSPYRASHTHHRPGDLAEVLPGNGRTYLEACRLIRVNGMFQVAADLKQESVALVPTNNFGADPSISDARERYETFALDYIGQRFVTQTAPDPAVLAAAAGLDDPASIELLPENDARWLHARGLAIDYLEPSAVAKIDGARSNCSLANPAFCVLPYIPMTAINVTELATWDETDTPDDPGDIWLKVESPSDVIFGDPLNPTRGASTVNPAIDLSALPAIVPNVSRINLGWSNAGVALFSAINPDDVANVLQDGQEFTTSSESTPGLGFNVNIGGLASTSDSNEANNPSVELPPIVPGFTNSCSPDSARRPNPYACSWSSDTNPTSTEVTVGKYNFIAVTNTNVANPCNPPRNTKANQCVYNEINVGASSATGATLGSISYDPSTDSITQLATIEISGLTEGATIDIVFREKARFNATTYVCNGSEVVWTCP